MDSEIWGPHGWFFLHTITFTYPDNPSPNEKAQYYNFFINLQYVLPCEICKKNYPNHLKELPLDDMALENKKSLTKWLVGIHNLTNRDLNKPQMKYKEVLKRFNEIFEGKKNKSNKVILYLIGILVILYLINRFLMK
tara:strand:- start:4467 stop:4877 length:411 start_codon:yes stop_codon:yes gene_type:complete